MSGKPPQKNLFTSIKSANVAAVAESTINVVMHNPSTEMVFTATPAITQIGFFEKNDDVSSNGNKLPRPQDLQIPLNPNYLHIVAQEPEIATASSSAPHNRKSLVQCRPIRAYSMASPVLQVGFFPGFIPTYSPKSYTRQESPPPTPVLPELQTARHELSEEKTPQKINGVELPKALKIQIRKEVENEHSNRNSASLRFG